MEESLSTCKFLSGVPLIIGIQRPALPVIACQTINAATFFFSKPPLPPPQGIEIIIMLCFIGPSLLLHLCLTTSYSSLSWVHIIRQYNAVGGLHTFRFRVCLHELDSSYMYVCFNFCTCICPNYKSLFFFFGENQLVCKRISLYCPGCFSDRHGLLLLYLIALENDRRLFIKETVDCEWAESRTEFISN